MKVKLLINYILQFCLVFLLYILIVGSVFSFTILNSNYVIKVFNSTNYYEKLNNEIKDEMSNYIIQSGLDESVLDGIYTEEDLYNDVNNSINKTYEGKDYAIDTTNMENKLQENINNYLSNTSLEITDDNAINNFVSQMADIYETRVNVFQSVSIIGKILSLGSYYLKVILIIIAILVLIILFILNKVFNKKILPTALFTSFMMLFATYLYLYHRIDLNINLYSECISLFVIQSFKNIYYYLKLSSIITLILGLIILIFEKRKVIKNAK